jgi:transposase
MTIPEKTRRLVVEACRGGEGSLEDLARRFRVSERSIRRWRDQQLETGSLEPSSARRGRQPKIGQGHQLLIRQLLAGWDPALRQKIDPPSNQEIIQRLAQDGLDVSPSSLSRTLVAMGLRQRNRRGAHRDRLSKEEDRAAATDTKAPRANPDLRAAVALDPDLLGDRALLSETGAKTLAEAFKGRSYAELHELTGLSVEWLEERWQQLPGRHRDARKLDILRRYPGIKKYRDTVVAEVAGVHARTVARARREHGIPPARPYPRAGTHADVVLALVESEGSASEESIIDHVQLQCSGRRDSTLSALSSLVDRGLLRADGDTYSFVRSPDGSARKDLLRRRRQHLRRRKPQSRSDQDQVEDIDF